MSYRAIIVDDESFARMTLKAITNWEELGLAFVGEARNGKEALTLIQELQPDLIFVDISMPVMDGIALLRAVQQMPLLSVVLSSYDDFDYVRSALQLGAVDYLHKPKLEAGEIAALIQRLDSEFSRRRGGANSFRRDTSRITDRQAFLEELLFHPSQPSVTVDGLERYSIEIRGSYAVLSLEIEEYRKISGRYSNGDCYMLNTGIDNVFSSLQKRFSRFYSFSMGAGSYLLLLGFEEMGRKEQEQLLERIVDRVRRSLRQYLNIGVSIGSSPLYSRVEEMRRAEGEARLARENTFFLGSEALVIYDEDCELKDVPEPSLHAFIHDTIRDLHDALGEDSYGRCRDCIEGFCRRLHRERCLRPGLIRQYLVDIYCLLGERFTGLVYSLGDLNRAFLPVERLLDAHSLKSAGAYLLKVLSFLEETAQDSCRESGKSYHVIKAIEYISSNYMDQELSLSVLAEELGINNSYLSRLFRRETGSTITSFLNSYRIRMAQYYLRNSDRRHYEISEMVGYKNVEYFNNIFKKISGITPKEYRLNACSPFASQG